MTKLAQTITNILTLSSTLARICHQHRCKLTNHKRRKATNFEIGNFTEANRFLVAKMGLSNMQWNYSAIRRSILEQLSELRAFDSNWYDNKNITNEVKGMVT